MVLETELNGAPHRILPFQGKLLVAVGNSVRKKRFVMFYVKYLMKIY